MKAWPKNPSIYEISTWVWLHELGQKYHKQVDLAAVPSGEWDQIASYGFDAVWLMGVWERSPEGMAIGNRDKGLVGGFRQVLSDYKAEDNAGSPYCVRRYSVDAHLGGPEGLAVARKELAKRGMKLILDFVPNHVAPDHPWIVSNPEYFIQGNADDARRDPASFVDIKGKVFACGRDPYFPAWQDVLQLNAFQPGLRQAALETLTSICGQCDGVRCDMAMLLINSIFERTWGNRAGKRPATEYWIDLIPVVKKLRPDFIFMAEAYWDLEWELQQQGFDYCYDKRLYDRLREGHARPVREHLHAEPAYQFKLVRFLENHDEPRAASVFEPGAHRAAAVVTYSVPGLRFFHQGQFEGRMKRIPPQLSRAPKENPDKQIGEFYDSLFALLKNPVMRSGQWQRLSCKPAWEGNGSWDSFIAHFWLGPAGQRLVVAVNYASHQSQCYLSLPFPEIRNRSVKLKDCLSSALYIRVGNDLLERGLYLDLQPWAYHIFELEIK